MAFMRLARADCSNLQNTPPAIDEAQGKLGASAHVSLTRVPNGAMNKDMKAGLRVAVETVTNFSWLSKGDTVFIKPAHNSGQVYPATTKPAAVGAMVELLKEKGAGRVIVGDMAGIEHVKLTARALKGSTRRLAEISGMAYAVRAAGGEMHFFEEAGWNAFYEDVPAMGPSWKRGIMMPRILKEADHIVLMPRCARHVLAGATLGMKAAVGYWRTDTRLEYHRDAATLHEKTAEGNTVPTLLKKQRLVVSAADKILTTYGPNKGVIYTPETGLIIASESVVAHDMVSLAWLLENTGNVSMSRMEYIKDRHPWVALLGNYYVVHRLGGWRPALMSDRLVKNDLKTIWEDRVLNQAYRVLGGIPQILLETADNTLPAEVAKRLAEKIKWGQVLENKFMLDAR